MATHSSILAWRIPWTQEPVSLLSIESQESQTQLKQLSTAHTAQCEKQIQNSVAFFKSTFVISYYLAKSDGLRRAAILCYTVPSGDGSCKTASFTSLVF